ncbi:MAG: ABC transporter ATP-binding protein [Desulfobacterales bacterium]|nr:ABC transporter ATP-binding protein [Desulfobacterales bacterium]
MSIVTVDTVSKNFGGHEAVSQVSFSVAEGTIMGLVGSDGAGKTTLLRMVAAMLKPTAGRIFVKGHDVVSQKKTVKPLIGYMPQRFGLYQDLTVDENIDFFMDIFGITGKERQTRKDFYLGFSNLLPFVHRLARDLSGGMKQKLGLACVLVHEPAVLILDEPTNGVDPVSRQEFWDILSQMRHDGMTILVSTAYLDEGEKCDHLMLMHNAHLLAESSPQALRLNFPDLETAMIHRIQAADKALADERFNP